MVQWYCMRNKWMNERWWSDVWWWKVVLISAVTMSTYMSSMYYQNWDRRLAFELSFTSLYERVNSSDILHLAKLLSSLLVWQLTTDGFSFFFVVVIVVGLSVYTRRNKCYTTKLVWIAKLVYLVLKSSFSYIFLYSSSTLVRAHSLGNNACK